LTSATLAALPTFFPLITTGTLDDANATVDTNLLRQVLTAFLPSGGLIDRLGDNRERTREKARESMVVLGGLAFRTGSSSLHLSTRGRDTGKGPETPFMIWERLLREGGLQSKVWRVREQVGVPCPYSVIGSLTLFASTGPSGAMSDSQTVFYAPT
jgi:CLIP-associating protein 1/2